MNEQIGDCEDRLVLVFSQDDIDLCSVLLDDDAVDGQRDRDPLVLLDAAVIVRIEVAEPVALIERILLDVDARRIDVGAQNVHALFDRLLPDVVEHQRLAVVLGVDLIACFQLRAFRDAVGQIPVARLLRHLDGNAHAFAFGLAPVQTILIADAQVLHLCSLLIRIYFPKTFLSCHDLAPFSCFCLMLFPCFIVANVSAEWEGNP